MIQKVMVTGLTNEGDPIIDGRRVGRICELYQGYIRMLGETPGPNRRRSRYFYNPYILEDDPYLKQLEEL